MNRIYKVIWNSETEQWVAASELAHAKGKSKSKNLKRLAALGLCGMLAGTAAAAIPEGVAQSPTDVAVGTGSEAKGTYSTAYGETAKANTVFATALGSSAQAQGQSAIAIGREANAQSDDTVAVGGKAAAAATNAVVVGKEASVRAATSADLPSGITAAQTGATAGTGSVAVGANAKAYGTNATTIGQSSNALGQNSLAGGQAAKAYGKSSVALGDGALASNDAAAAVGTSAQATAGGTAALGYAANAAGFGAAALGRQAQALGTGDISIGDNAGKNRKDFGTNYGGAGLYYSDGLLSSAAAASVATHTNIALGKEAAVNSGGIRNIAIGSGAGTSHFGEDSISIGTNANNFKANGAADGTKTDTPTRARHTIAVGQNAMTYGENSIALGNGAKTTNFKYNTGAATPSYTSASRAMAIGESSDASGTFATAFGFQAKTERNDSTAIGKQAKILANPAGNAATLGNHLAIGNESLVGQNVGSRATVVGYQAQAVGAGNNKLAVGTQAVSSGTIASAVGVGAKAHGDTTSAYGSYTQVSGGFDSMAAGSSAAVVSGSGSSTASSQAAIGSGSITAAKGAVSVGTGTMVFGENSASIGANGGGSAARMVQALANGKMDDTVFSIIGGKNNQSVGNRNLIGSTSNNNTVFGNDIKVGASAASVTSEEVEIDTADGKVKHTNYKPAFTNTKNIDSAVAVGNAAKVGDSNTVAVGKAAEAAGLSSTAIGETAAALKQNGIAIGKNAKAGTSAATASSDADAVAIGTDSAAYEKDTVALGNTAKATADSATALGKGAKASQVYATAVGLDTVADGNSALAAGSGAAARANSATAVGNDAQALGTDASAFGRDAQAAEEHTVAVGSSTRATAAGAIAVGNDAQATAADAAAIGKHSRASSTRATAVGNSANAAGVSSVAVGDNAQAQNDYAVSIGAGSAASAIAATAIGNDAKAKQWSSVALGRASETADAVATTAATVGGISYNGFAGTAPEATVSIGSDTVKRTLTNLAAGRIAADSTDAVNGSQLYAVADTLGGKLTHYYSVNSTATGAGSNYNNDGASGTDALAAGAGASAKQMSSVAIGKNAVADGDNSQSDSVAIGTGAKASGNASLAIGPGASTSGSDSLGGIAIGAAASSQNGGLSLGSGADSGNGTALIPGLPVRLNNNVALGDSATVKNDTNFRVALGSMSIAGVSDLGTDPYKPSANASVKGIAESGVTLGEVSVGGDNRAGQGEILYRRITNLAAGSADTDAVNVSQLKALADARSKVAGSGLASVSSATDSAGATTYTVNVAQAAAPTVTRGNVAVAAADAGKVMTAGDVAAAINNSEKTSSVVAGSTAVSVSAGSEDAAGNTQYTVDLGTAAKASLGKADSALQNIRSGSPNLSVAKNGDTVTVGMSTTPAFTSVTTGDTVLNSGGLTIAPAGKTPVVLNSDGLNNGGNKITNVAAGNISAASTDAVNGSQLYALGEKPLTFTGDSGSVRRKLGETLAVKGDGTYVSTKAENGGVNISVSENAVRDTARKAVDVKGEGVITVTPSQDNTAHTTTYTVKYDGGKAAAATDIAYTANGGTVRKTSLAKGFNFSNGANTTAEVGADGIVKFNAVTGSIATTGGKAAVAAADAGKLATAGDVAEAVNNAAWKVTAKADGGELESGASVESVKAGDQVGLQVGKNLKLKQNGKNFTYLLNDTLTGLNSASFGGGAGKPSAVIDGSGVRITPAGGGKAVFLTDKGLDNGGQTIANVASGGSTETNAANIGDVKKAAAAAKNTVSAGDANVTVTPKAFSDGHTDYAVKLADKLSLGKGKVSLDGTGGDISAANSIKAGNTITAGQGANAVAIDGTKAEVKAGKVTVNGKDGHITGLANTTWVSGQTAPVSGRAATEDQLKAVDNQVAQNKTDIAKLSGNIGQGLNFAGNTGSVNKKLGSTVNIVGEGTKADSRYSGENVKTMVDANGNLVVKTDKDLKAESLTLAKDGKTGVAITTDNGAGNISLNGANGAKTDIAAAKGAAVLGGSAQADRIRYTGSDGTSREAATMDDGMRYGGDNLASDGTIDKKLNQRLDIVGGADKAKLSDNNIGVNKDSQGRLKVQLSKELNSLSSASFADGSGNTAVVNGAGSTVRDSAGNQTAVGAGGVSITPASGNAVSLGGGGLDNGGNKITNVAAGEKATDAVNVGQLNAKLGAITEAANLNFNALEHKIDNIGETANAGVAGAIAQGSIPQVTRPGASGLGVGSGYYGGQSALAVGMSSMSDGGNWIVKGNISVNTKGRVGAGAGALYQW
ncbi:YadA-like family protein [Neisseria bacilliformis]|uniref:YadA-like family protein n=1 Tax=Neisseria bacilliformis TaxID=267212 RepID=UPI000B0148D7|nr:YadA-like family protein [Neisseria bacilliformis]